MLCLFVSLNVCLPVGLSALFYFGGSSCLYKTQCSVFGVHISLAKAFQMR